MKINITKIHDEPIQIGINELPILLEVWNGESLVRNLNDINSKNIFDGYMFRSNVDNNYIYPMDIVVCNGARHSQFVGRLNNQGKTIIQTVSDYSNLYNYVKFDGATYKFLENDVPVFDPEIFDSEINNPIFFYSGVIYELGRILLENNFRSRF